MDTLAHKHIRTIAKAYNYESTQTYKYISTRVHVQVHTNKHTHKHKY